MSEVRILGKEYVINDGITIIGRSDDADIKIDSTKLSRAHARFVIEGGRIFIQDLGSKNGTFVNGTRIEGKKEILKGDKVKIADIDVQIVHAKPVQPVQKAQPKPSLGKAARRSQRKQKEMIKKVVVLAVLAVVGLAVFSYIKNYVPHEQNQARALLSNAEEQVSRAEISAAIGDNTELKDRLASLQNDLAKIPEKFKKEHETAGKLIETIRAKLKEIEAKNSELQTAQEARSLFSSICDQAAQGTVGYAEAVSRLENLHASYPGTEAAEKALAKIQELGRLMLEQERTVIAEAKSKAEEFVSSGNFSQALSVVQACAGKEFVKVSRKEVDALVKFKQEIKKKAEKHFSHFAEQAIKDAAAGDCGRLKDGLKNEFKRIGMTELEPIFTEAAMRIDEIKAERIAQAKARLKRDLAKIEKLEKKRMFEDAGSLYKKLIGKITEPELRKEIEEKNRINELKRMVKEAVIRLVNKRNGIEITGLGFLKKMNKQNVELQIEGQTMPIGWDKIRDSEFLILAATAVSGSSDPETCLAYAILLSEKGDEAEADTFFSKSLSLSPSLKSQYADIFSEYEKRKVQRAEEEKKRQAELAAKREKEKMKQPGADFYPPLYYQNNPPEVVIVKDPSLFKVYPRHPRLFFRDTDIPFLQKRRSTHSYEWQKLTGHAGATILRDPAELVKRPKSWGHGRNTAFVWVMTGQERYREWVLRWVNEMMRVGSKTWSGSIHDTLDEWVSGRLLSMGVVYDWLFSSLDDEMKKKLHDSIVEHLEENWRLSSYPTYIGGHSRYASLAASSGLIALVTEYPELMPKLLEVRNNWIHGYDPVQAWIAVDGGYHMGFDYTGSYTDSRNYCIWSSATNESRFYPWIEYMPFLWIYGDRGDGAFHRVGDWYGSRGNRATITLAAGLFKNPYALWLIHKINRETNHDDLFYSFLYEDKRVKELAPDNKEKPLPLSRHFRNAGVVLMRDRWDQNTTLLHFKCSSFVSIGHHHQDENGFSLSYRGRLAIDSGCYERGSTYGYPHWYNYFTRTIAHNCITVFDPHENIGNYNDKSISNDGGQMWRGGARRLEDIAAGGRVHIDGITGYAEEKFYAYAKGNATKTYNQNKVKLFTRSMVYLRQPIGWQHPVIVCFDHVISKNPKHKKSFLLHSVSEPNISNNRVEIVEGGGKLHSITVLPVNAQIEKIGGPGKRFWVNGKNWPLNEKGYDPDDLYRWSGSWRVEVSPSVPANEDFFLHVLAVCNKEESFPPPKCALVDSGIFKGVIVSGYALLFNKTEQPLPSGQYALPHGGAKVHLIFGVIPSTGYALRIRGTRIGKAMSSEGGSVGFRVSSSKRGPFSFSMIKVDAALQ